MRQVLHEQWRLTAESGESVPAAVPGDINLDLFRAGKLPDPYYADNFKAYRQVSAEDYVYEVTFEADAEILAGERQFLVFEGIDTFADIFLNGVLLATTDSMFLEYRLNVDGALRAKNVLRVRMKSTVRQMTGIGNSKYFSCFHPDRIFVRKSQCHFGWDWAPEVPGYGIYRSVYLETRPLCAIEDCFLSAKIDGSVSLRAELSYDARREFGGFGKDGDSRSGDRLVFTVSRKPNCRDLEQDTLSASVPVSGAKAFVNLRIPNPGLWNVNGFGRQDLYYCKAELVREGRVLDVAYRRFGFREIKLIESPVDSNGMTFQFEVNGSPCYIKGSNWVPAMCFTGAMSKERYRGLIELARDANLNMLRVWGGGIYEDAAFYELCEEKGILVWQDFMFSCADIPEDDPDFRERILKELTFQTKRLRNYTSLAVWCGGNEKTGCFRPEPQFGDELVNYTLRGIVGHLDGTRPYLSQSPHSLTDYGSDTNSGDSHVSCFESALESGNLTDFREILRNSEVSFSSECAILGPCRLKSLRKFIPEENLWPINSMYEERFLNNPYAFEGSPTYVRRELLFAESFFGSVDGVEDFVKKAMLAHAEQFKAEAEHHRSRKFCSGGFLNWMYNDIWPTGTWSLVDFYLEPKAAYFAAKRAYAPVLPVMAMRKEQFVPAVVNDTLTPLEGTLTVVQKTVEGEILAKTQSRLAVPANGLAECPAFSPSPERSSYLKLEFCTESHVYKNFFYPHLWKDLTLVPPNLRCHAGEIIEEGGLFCGEIRITAESALARSVSIELRNDGTLYPEDNFFDLERGETATVKFKSPKPFTADQIRVLSYSDVWEY